MSHSKEYIESKIHENLQIGKIYKTTSDMFFSSELDYDFNNPDICSKRVYLENNSLLIFLGYYKRLKSCSNSIIFLYKNKILYYHFADYHFPFFENIKYYLKEFCEQ